MERLTLTKTTTAAAVSLLLLLSACGSSSDDGSAGGDSDKAASTAVTPGDTVKVSIPSPVKGGDPVLVDVTVPKAGAKFGIPSPIHADPGQGSLDDANAAVYKLLGGTSKLQDAKLDISRHVQLMDSMITGGFVGITTDELAPNSLDAVRARAASAKVSVCLQFSNEPGGVNEDDDQAGSEMVAYLKEQLPDGGDGLIINNTPAPVTVSREEAFTAALGSETSLKTIGTARNLKETVANARQLTETLLQAHPDAKWIWTTNDIGAIGAGLAAKALNKDVVILGMNGSPEAVKAIQDGLISATWDSNQNAIGALAALNCVNASSTGELGEAQLVKYTKITADNAESWIPWADRAPSIKVVG